MFGHIHLTIAYDTTGVKDVVMSHCGQSNKVVEMEVKLEHPGCELVNGVLPIDAVLRHIAYHSKTPDPIVSLMLFGQHLSLEPVPVEIVTAYTNHGDITLMGESGMNTLKELTDHITHVNGGNRNIEIIGTSESTYTIDALSAKGDTTNLADRIDAMVLNRSKH